MFSSWNWNWISRRVRIVVPILKQNHCQLSNVSHVTCHLSHVTFHMSPLTCHMSHVTCPQTTTLCSFTCYESPGRLGDAPARGLMIDRVKQYIFIVKKVIWQTHRLTLQLSQWNSSPKERVPWQSNSEVKFCKKCTKKNIYIIRKKKLLKKINSMN